MKKDSRLEKIIKEDGIVHAPEEFTQAVLNRLAKESNQVIYKPLISKLGRIIIGLFILTIIVAAAFTGSAEAAEPLFSFPDLKLDIPEIGWKIPSAMLAALLAVFVLVLIQSRLNRSDIR